MDGTFPVSPPQFAQLYTVHGLQNGRNVVGAYTLLPNKRLDSYVKMLNEIKNLTNSVHPESIMIPKKDCLFRLTKNIYREVQ